MKPLARDLLIGLSEIIKADADGRVFTECRQQGGERETRKYWLIEWGPGVKEGRETSHGVFRAFVGLHLRE